MRLSRNALHEFEEYVKLSKRLPPEIVLGMGDVDQPSLLADEIAAHLPIRVDEKQALLESLDARERLERLSVALRSELEIWNWSAR